MANIYIFTYKHESVSTIQQTDMIFFEKQKKLATEIVCQWLLFADAKYWVLPAPLIPQANYFNEHFDVIYPERHNRERFFFKKNRVRSPASEVMILDLRETLHEIASMARIRSVAQAKE